MPDKTSVPIPNAALSAIKPALAADLDAVLFSLKSFVAAILALYVSLRIGLTNPVWSIGAVYTVSMPLSGASVSRSLFRFLGTVGGAAAVVLLVPTFVNEPLVLSVVLAAWTGFCLYLALLDRTARAYAFQLAGYMTCLIGFPYVAVAGDIFTVAVLRVQEVSIGILAATLLHSLVLPRKVSDRVKARLAGLLADAERWTGDTLAPARNSVLVRDRSKIALGLLELHQNAVHLPFDAAREEPRRQILRLLHDRLLAVLSLSGAIEDGLAELRAEGRALPASLARLFARARSWLATPAPSGRLDADPTEDLLRELREEAMGRLGAGAGSGAWSELRLANLAFDLHALVAAHRECRLLRQDLTAPPGWRRRLPLRLIGRGQGYVFHRDHWLAARSGIGVMVGITLCCGFWIASGWADGAGALFVLGPVCMLCGTADAPFGNVLRCLIGMAIGLVVGLVYGFVIFPRTTDFVSLAAVLAPVLLVAGMALAKPPFAFAALSLVLTFPVIAGLSPLNAASFPSAVNSSLAALVGGAMALSSVRLFQTLGLDLVTGRIRRALRRDVAALVAGRRHDTARWTSRMLDRIGLLIPRLAGDGASTDLLRFALADIRVGQTGSRLRAFEKTLAGATARARLAAFLRAVAAHFRGRAPAGDALSLRDLLAQIDGVRDAVAAEAAPVRAQGFPCLPHCAATCCCAWPITESEAMFTEIPVGGVALPGLLILAFLALLLTALSSRLLTGLGIHRRLALRPLAELSLFVLWLGLLVQVAPGPGLFR